MNNSNRILREFNIAASIYSLNFQSKRQKQLKLEWYRIQEQCEARVHIDKGRTSS